MKIRDGFVSNSSSSSFLLLVKKDSFEKEYNKLSEEHRKIIDEHFTKDKIFNMDVYKYTSWSSNSCSSFEDLEEGVQDIIEEFNEKFKDNDRYEHSEDW